jgi:hypothetical protein
MPVFLVGEYQIQESEMVRSSRLRRLMPLAALALVMTLGGCYAYPAYPGYGYYGGGYYNGGYYNGGYYPAPYYGGGVVAFSGGGWGWHGGGWHH